MTLDPQLTDAVKRLQIADVILKSIDAHLTEDINPNAIGSGSDLSFQIIFPTCTSIRTFEATDGVRRVVFEMLAGIRVINATQDQFETISQEEIERLIAAQIECTFYVYYDERIDGDGSLDVEALGLYAQQNVPFSLWPYWREIVQSACGRMGLPRVVLPTHRLRAPTKPLALVEVEDATRKG